MKFDKSWTIFLDRDGVINKEIRDDYVTEYSSFEFEDGALVSLKKINEIFGTIIIITNQRGVGIGKMTVEELADIHSKMKIEIENNGGRIDKIYAAIDADRTSINRKPNNTMALSALQDFPNINFEKTIMVGNSISDMEFGRGINCYNVFIDEKKRFNNTPTSLMDEIHSSLFDFVESLK